jgi:ribosome maturation factor RimP
MARSGKERISTVVRELAQPVAEDLGYSLWDVEFVKEGGADYLRITIDRDGGVTIDDAERMHRAIEPLLDEADPIEGSYYLEISSPGVERELKSEAHLSAYLGKEVRVRLYKAKDGERERIGILSAADGESVTVACGDRTETFSRKEIAKINAYYDFSRDVR